MKRRAPASKKVTAVPKRAPKFVSSFAEFVAEQQPDERRREKMILCGKTVQTAIEKQWPEYYDYVQQHITKKPRSESSGEYTESKLKKDVKTILTKLTDMKDNLQNLNPDETYEHLFQVVTLAQEVYNESKNTPTVLPPIVEGAEFDTRNVDGSVSRSTVVQTAPTVAISTPVPMEMTTALEEARH